LLGEKRTSISGDWMSAFSQKRKFVVFDMRRFVIANPGQCRFTPWQRFTLKLLVLTVPSGRADVYELALSP
jgi:hypothetical protein